MARVSSQNFTNPIKSITYIPDGYINLVGKYVSGSDVTLKAGTVVKINFTTMEITAASSSAKGNAIVFTDTDVVANEGTPVTVLIQGIVDKAKLDSTSLANIDTANQRIVVVG